MKQREYTVKGMTVGEIPEQLTEIGMDTSRHASEGTDIVLLDSFAWRIMSTVRLTVIFDRTSRSTCKITAIAGGPGTSLLTRLTGVERSMLGTLDKALEQQCEFLELDLVRH